jgi:pimeloyl-ACP methyl ester carboxylesterase
MLEAARTVKTLAEDIIAKELDDNPDYNLLLVGHSLGGSVAAVLGQLWAETFRDVTVYTYGPACVAPMNDMNSVKVVSVLLEGDPFSSVSLGHVADTSRALAYLCEEDDLRIAILTVTDGPLESLDKEDIRWCNGKMEEIRKQMSGEKLYPPGRLMFLSDPEDKKAIPTIQEVPPFVFDELKISARMFDLSRHVPRVYQRRLKNALRRRTAEPSQ